MFAHTDLYLPSGGERSMAAMRGNKIVIQTYRNEKKVIQNWIKVAISETLYYMYLYALTPPRMNHAQRQRQHVKSGGGGAFIK